MMHKTTFNFVVTVLAALLLSGCKENKTGTLKLPVEDLKAKSALQGIWVDADEETVVFKIKGDTVYYPDSTSRPAEFKVINDTMILIGSNESRYPIMRREPHIFEFKNQNNEIVKLVKSDDPNDTLRFMNHRPIALNQGKIVKKDTVVRFDDRQYHSYVQVNPTTYKVYRSFYNAEGIEIDNIYYDNIIHISVFSGAAKVFSKDFRKTDFTDAVPENMLKQCILSDIKLMTSEPDGLHYQTQLAIPDSPLSYIVELIISYDGKTKVRLFR